MIDDIVGDRLHQERKKSESRADERVARYKNYTVVDIDQSNGARTVQSGRGKVDILIRVERLLMMVGRK